MRKIFTITTAAAIVAAFALPSCKKSAQPEIIIIEVPADSTLLQQQDSLDVFRVADRDTVGYIEHF